MVILYSFVLFQYRITREGIGPANICKEDVNVIINRFSWWVECSPMALETKVQSQVASYQRQKMVLDASLLNTQHYKVPIKSKAEKSLGKE